MIGFPAAPRQIDRTASLVALLLVATVTEAMFLLLPSFVGALGDVLHLSATRTGLLASADLTGIALTTATAPWWLRRVSWRRTVLASLLAFLLINLLCFAVRAFWPLLCLRVLAGLSAGAAYPIALAGVLDTTRAPRNTGLMMSLQVVFGAAGVYAIDAVRLTWRLSYFIITFNDVDATGRFVAVYGTASHMALAVGPYVGGLLIVDRSYTPLLWSGVIAVSACYACFLAAIGLGRAARGAPRTAPPAHPCR